MRTHVEHPHDPVDVPVASAPPPPHSQPHLTVAMFQIFAFSVLPVPN